jgi:hypothetical protein
MEINKKAIKAKILWFLGGLILGFIVVLLVRKEPEKPTVEPYLRKIASQQRVIDAMQERLSKKTDSIIIKYETEIVEIEVIRDEKIDSIANLNDSAKLGFFTNWVSEVDSL